MVSSSNFQWNSILQPKYCGILVLSRFCTSWSALVLDRRFALGAGDRFPSQSTEAAAAAACVVLLDLGLDIGASSQQLRGGAPPKLSWEFGTRPWCLCLWDIDIGILGLILDIWGFHLILRRPFAALGRGSISLPWQFGTRSWYWELVFMLGYWTWTCQQILLGD